MAVKERVFFALALALSLMANVWLSWRLHSRPERFSPKEKQKLQELAHRLAVQRGEKVSTARDDQTVTLAIALGDCAACFNFLQSFAFFCQGQESRCRVLLVGGTQEQASQLAERFSLQMPVQIAQELPSLPLVANTPVVWAGEATSPLLVEEVPGDVPGQRHLLRKLFFIF